MYERIVVPLDGSTEAERALPWARVIAARSDGEVRLVHVHVPLRIPTGQTVLGPRVRSELRRITEDARSQVSEYLHETGQRVVDETAAQYTAELLRGPPAASVAREADCSDAALVVMAPRDRTPLERIGNGSMTEQVARICPAPVLAIRSGVAAEQPECREVIVPLDGTERTVSAVRHGAAMAALFDATVILLRVLRPGRRSGYRAATAYLEGLVDDLAATGVPVETRIERSRDIARAINHVAQEDGHGMIVIASGYRDGLPRIVRGGTAEAVLRSARVPVLIVNRRAEA